MTEKRFNIEYVHGNPTIWHITDCGEHIVDEKICDLLNDLNDENEQLQEAMEKLFVYFAKWFEEERGTYIDDFNMLWRSIQNGEIE